MEDLKELYKEDTIGRKYHVPIVSKKKGLPIKTHASELLSINLNKPISKNEFKNLSDSLKLSYINHLHDKYCCTGRQLARMLGYSNTWFSKRIVPTLDLKSVLKGRPTLEQRKGWEVFCKGDNLLSSSVNKTEVLPSTNSETSTPEFCSGSFTIKGKVNIDNLRSRILGMIDEGLLYRITVNIETIQG